MLQSLPAIVHAVLLSIGVLAALGHGPTQRLFSPQPSQDTCLVDATPIIGGLIGESPVSQIAMSESRVLLAHPLDRGVTLLEESRQRRTVIGRDGAGPGEFRWVSAVGFAGTNLWVYDGTLRRATLFDAEGVSRRTFDLATVARRGTAELKIFAMLEDGTLFGAYLQNGSSSDKSSYVVSPVVRLRQTSDKVWSSDSIGTIRQRPPLLTVPVSDSEARALFVPELSHNDAVAASPEGHFVVWTEHRFDGAGRVTGVEAVRFETTTGNLVRIPVPSIADRSPTDSQKRAYFTTKLADGFDSDAGDELARVVSVLVRSGGDDWEKVRKISVDDAGRVWVGLPSLKVGEVAWRALQAQALRANPPIVTLSEVTAFSANRVLVACNSADALPTVVTRRIDSNSGS